MRVIFLCTGNQYNPDMEYKENYFIKAAVECGDEAIVIASQYMYVNGINSKVPIQDEFINGYRLIRVKYHKILNEYITEKIRKVDGLAELIIGLKPEVIFVNCPQVYNINDMEKIKKECPGVHIVVDFSTKYINSARNALSKYVLHKGIYRRWLKRSEEAFDKIQYVSAETKEFIIDMYGLNQKHMEYNSLPTEIISEEERKARKKKIYDKYGFTGEQIIFANSGKIGRLKKTIELVKAFSRIEQKNFRLIIAGSIEEEIKTELMYLIDSDDRVIYTGFLKGEELVDILCATDMYMQPGTISQTSQTALGCSCAVTLMECPTNVAQIDGNGYLLQEDKDVEQQLLQVFEMIREDRTLLTTMKQKSYELAVRELDYKVLYKRTVTFEGM